jgi:hypothetical protein
LMLQEGPHPVLASSSWNLGLVRLQNSELLNSSLSQVSQSQILHYSSKNGLKQILYSVTIQVHLYLVAEKFILSFAKMVILFLPLQFICHFSLSYYTAYHFLWCSSNESGNSCFVLSLSGKGFTLH